MWPCREQAGPVIAWVGLIDIESNLEVGAQAEVVLGGRWGNESTV